MSYIFRIFVIYIYIYKHSQSINCYYQKILNKIIKVKELRYKNFKREQILESKFMSMINRMSFGHCTGGTILGRRFLIS